MIGNAVIYEIFAKEDMFMSTLPIMSCERVPIEMKGFSGTVTDALSKTSNKVVNVSTEVVQKGITNILKSMSELLNNTEFENDKYEIEEMKINLNVGANGEVSIMSLSGEASLTSSISITIKKR